ncbi:MAG: ABC transporter ATP-binding protein [Clostridiales bacterium]|jgi:ABC-type multidrug transport system ATPase subunit|nr:ABC transporter ATP-binding protein [Clostridiales bacterium]
MITIEKLKKKYGDRTVLDIESLNFANGKSYALVGANGSGKSTLLKILAGIERPTDGVVKFTAGVKIAYMPQRSVGFKIGTAANLRLVCGDKARIDASLESFGLTELRRKNASKLSGGETQRLALARTLLVPFNLLLLDEPTAAMDINSAVAATEEIRKAVKNAGAAFIFSTHSLPQAKELSDFIVFLDGGKVAETIPSESPLSEVADDGAKAFLKSVLG